VRTPGVLKRPLDVFLIGLGVISIAGALLAHEDPFARDALCSQTSACFPIPHGNAWSKILYDLAMGALVSLIFYVLIVRLPEFQKRRRYRKLLASQYQSFREDCISLILLVADGSYNGALPETLSDQQRFRAYFEEMVTSDEERWHRFCNRLDEYHQKEIIKRMEILRDEIAFILNNIDIPSDEPLKFLKRLSTAIYLNRDATLGYDDVKRFSGFLWIIFAGWNPVSGYRERDVIQNMIEAI
jgi:hypothetical protein